MPDLLTEAGEELSSPPGRWRPVGWSALVIVLVALGSFVVGRNSTVASYSSAPSDRSSNDASLVARPLPTKGLSLGLGNNLLVGVACPTRLGAPGAIAVSFRLVNWGQANVVITDLAVSGSAHGLRSMGETSGGSCEQPSHGAVGGALVPGGSQLYTFWFHAPAGCPGALRTVPLGVRVASLTGTTTKAVSRDVGRVWASTCPQAP